MRVTRWIDRQLEGGSIFKRYFVPLLKATRYFSVAYRWNIHVERVLKIPGSKGREWVSELYAILAVLVPLGCLLVAPMVNDMFWWGIVLVPLYVTIEVSCFSLRWVFTDLGPVFSYKRALAGFLLNVVGTVVSFATTFVAFDCIAPRPGESTWSRAFTALYSSTRTAVTIGPSNSLKEPPESWQCGALVSLENAVMFLLAVISIAAIMGALGQRRKEYGGPTPIQPSDDGA